MRIELRPFAVALHRPLVTGAGTVDERRGVLVGVELDGRWGWGEAAPLVHMPGGSLDEVSAVLDAWRADPAGTDLTTVPVAAAAVDTALASLDAARAGRSLSRHLSAAAVPTVEVNALLGDAAPPALAAAAEAAVADGHRTVKVKVAADAARSVAAVREAVGPDIAVRVDANRSWSSAEAVAELRALAPLDVEFVEEPTPDLAEWATLASATGVVLAADESVVDPARVHDAVAAGGVGVVMVKVPLVGGVRPALAMARTMTGAGARVVVTSFLDTAVGLTAAVHVAAALGPGQPAAGLATAALLAEDVAPAPLIEAGRIAVPDTPGLGVAP